MDLTGPDPAPLIARAAQGDAEAFARLCTPLSGRLLLYIRRRAGRALGGDCDEEDLLQTVLAQVWKLLPSFEYRGRQAFYRWLVVLAQGAVADRVKYVVAKGRGNVRHLESFVDEAPGQADPADPATSVSRRAARSEEFRRVEQALDGLEPRHREVVERYLLDGQSLATIAAELGVTKNAVWERLHRGTARLKAAMKNAP